MSISNRIAREKFIRPFLNQGYSRKAANAFYRRTRYDLSLKNGVSSADKRWAHAHGFYSASLGKYGIVPGTASAAAEAPCLSDLQYRSLMPFNNSFAKWLNDLVTTNHVLIGYRDYLPQLYFHLINREGKMIILPTDTVNRVHGETWESFVALLKQRGRLVLSPVVRHDQNTRRVLEYIGGDEFRCCEDALDSLRKELILARKRNDPGWGSKQKISDIDSGAFDADVDVAGVQVGEALALGTYSESALLDAIRALAGHWVIYEPYGPDTEAAQAEAAPVAPSLLKLYVTTENLVDTRVLDGYVIRADADGGIVPERLVESALLTPDRRAAIIAQVERIANFVGEISYFAVYLVLTPEGPADFVIDTFEVEPVLPPVRHSAELDAYLRARFAAKGAAEKTDFATFRTNFKKKRFNNWTAKHGRPGIRPYMQKLWNDSVKDDNRNTKGYSRAQKKWAHERGFLSWRITQYGLTEDNYRDFLSDYQYHWLNRINNEYQIWINDKITTRYVFEPLKQYLAEYYYEIVRMDDGQTCLRALQDIPEGYGNELEDLLRLLRAKKLLACKPSAGTHGDGFYRLEYDASDDRYLVNAKPKTVEEISALFASFHSYYCVTEYLFNHSYIRNIYPNAVNTVRVAVVNQTAKNPVIMQTYFRIGASSSGFTDNIGYGGICADIDPETGYVSRPQQLMNHVYVDCPDHPDTGTHIEGHLPNWDIVRKGVIDICNFMPQLEYLGFDVAITDEGFKILEINIHQDLHRVAEHSDAFKQFYKDKMALKAQQYGLKEW